MQTVDQALSGQEYHPGILAEAEALAELSPWVNLGVYGPPGVGKTYLAGTIEDVLGIENPWYVDIEGGWISIRHRRKLMDRRVECRGWDKIGMVYKDLKYMVDHPDQFPGKVPDAVVLDHLTELQKVELRERMSGETADKRDWLINQNRMENLVRRFRDLPMHTIFIFHAKEEQEPSGLMKSKPNLPGKLAGNISGFLDIMGYYDRYETTETVNNNVVSVTRRLMFVQPTNKFVAKDRTGLLDPVLVDPTMNDIIAPVLAEYLAQHNGR